MLKITWHISQCFNTEKALIYKYKKNIIGITLYKIFKNKKIKSSRKNIVLDADELKVNLSSRNKLRFYDF